MALGLRRVIQPRSLAGEKESEILRMGLVGGKDNTHANTYIIRIRDTHRHRKTDRQRDTEIDTRILTHLRR